MQKQHQIRWRKSDEIKLNKVVKNFNQKIDRLIKKDPSLKEYLPEKITKKGLKENITTRKEFNRAVNKHKRFSKKGAEETVKSDRGAKATKWEVKEFKREEAIENRRRKKEREELENEKVRSRGKDTGVTRAEMGTIRENELKPSNKKFNNLSQEQWDKARKRIEKSITEKYQIEKKQRMKDNYLQGLKEAGYSDLLIEMVENTDLDSFVENAINDEQATFDFIYDPLELKEKEQSIQESWYQISNYKYNYMSHMHTLGAPDKMIHVIGNLSESDFYAQLSSNPSLGMKNLSRMSDDWGTFEKAWNIATNK